MAAYIFAFALIIVGFSFMAGMLHFAGYRKKGSGCCGSDLEDKYMLSGKLGCITCPNRGNEEACETD